MTKTYLGTGTTNTTPGSVHTLVVPERKIRLLLWGGASKLSDNNTFENAKIYLKQEYIDKFKGKYIITDKHVKVAKDIVLSINSMPDNSIKSLDIWTHGGKTALYLTTAEPPPSKEAGFGYSINKWVLHNSSLYISKARMVFNGAGWTDGSALASEIDFNKFTNDSKIEIHGCNTAEDAGSGFFDDNLAKYLSQRLFDAGKLNTTVIGHTENSIPRTLPNNKQDYRHQHRAIYKSGELLKIVNKVGALELGDGVSP